jgi:hypothetical protein
MADITDTEDNEAPAPLWKFKLDDGAEYELYAREFTVGILRHFKQWYGAAYGKYLVFIQLMFEGDCDAIACALWLAKRNAGEKPKEPRLLDFSVSDFFTTQPADDEDDEVEESDVKESDPPQSEGALVETTPA